MSPNNNPGLQKFLDDMAFKETPWRGVFRAYREFLHSRRSVELILDAVMPEIADLLEKLKKVERRLLELSIAKANKISPQNITEEMFLSSLENIEHKNAELTRVAKASCKKMARPMLQKLHPDKGGDAEMFDLVRKAIDSGDVELVQMFLYNMGTESADPDTILERVKVRRIEFEGSSVFKMASLFVNGNKETMIKLMRKNISDQILRAELMCIPQPDSVLEKL